MKEKIHLTHWKDHLKELKQLTTTIKEEAFKTKEETLGLYVVMEEVSNLMIRLFKQTNQLELFSTQQNCFILHTKIYKNVI